MRWSPAGAGHSRRRDELAGAARSHRANRGDGAVLHADLRVAPGRGGGASTSSTWPAARSRRSSSPASRAARCRAFASGSRRRGRRGVIDHAGASEVGPWGFADGGPARRARSGVGVHRRVSVRRTGEPAAERRAVAAVLTSLGRPGMPVIRYRTGDLVRPTWPDRGAESVRVARRRRAGPRRRHDDHPRRERLSHGGRADPAQLSRGGRVSHDGRKTRRHGRADRRSRRPPGAARSASPRSCICGWD